MKTETAPKDILFQTAARLFYQNGYRTIGVDTIAAASGIGKMTLYRHFPSKDDLITAYLRHSNLVFWDQFEHITQDATTGLEKLQVFFEALQSYVLSLDCYGCPFINVAVEYPQVDYSGHQVALEHKRSVLAKFQHLAEQDGVRQPAMLASALFLLMDGAYVAARMFGASPDNPAAHLAETARLLIDGQCGVSKV